jgi:tRNA pseudouridine38/39 synthase
VCLPCPLRCAAAAREFDFSKYRQRHIALEVMYVGWGFHGFARQENTENTIEVGRLLRQL